MVTWLGVFMPWIGLLVMILVQVMGCRWWPRPGLLSWVKDGFCTGLLAASLIGGEVVFQSSTATGLASATDYFGVRLLQILTFVVLGYGYFHFVNLGETARRIRILREFVTAGGQLTAPELLARYNAAEIVEKRLGRLLRRRQLRLDHGRYLVGRPTVLRMARLLDLLKWLLGGREAAAPAGESPAVTGAAQKAKQPAGTPPVLAQFTTPASPTERSELGRAAETAVANHLAALGYIIIDRNVRLKQGELDLVARHDGELIFVEVRARFGSAAGRPEESVDAAKSGRVARAAQEYIYRHGLQGQAARCDVAAVELDGHRPPEIRIIAHAFAPQAYLP